MGGVPLTLSGRWPFLTVARDSYSSLLSTALSFFDIAGSEEGLEGVGQRHEQRGSELEGRTPGVMWDENWVRDQQDGSPIPSKPNSQQIIVNGGSRHRRRGRRRGQHWPATSNGSN